MKPLLLICAGLLFIGIIDLPIGYYTFLRIIVTITAVAVVVTEFKLGFDYWLIAFGILAIVFNPIIPIYLNDKTTWALIDIVSGILCVIKSFTLKQKQNEN